ncbi:CubicO group peptidase, beta-lactamase class C family [Singulisphaera sp. GP187]|uniref:serine hydrolase domain-containing protein n=1 Tax=Singulisphaera sp. GP187 TaxID=1882752 RepID=UPI000926525F|nr:serine hydrolase [Singulisphaera sp. GP187]SIO33956.1 CubicO group peptidase, beta-lactamase class C family [Singulisphaera sp. GP187]
MGLIEQADSPLRRKVDDVAGQYVRSTRNVGLAVGLLAGDESLVLGYGKIARDDDRTPDGQTVFEIGSVTKVFSAALLAEMSGRGEVGIDQPVAELLPPEVRMPSRRGEPITLAHLSEHTSALPRLPGNLWPTVTDQKNPYRDYQVSHLYEYLKGARVGFPPGTGAAYSNLGAGLLGHVLSLRAGLPYGELMAERILRPLGLTDTAIALSEDQASRLAPGHDAMGKPTANWDLPTLAGAGALRSTADEMVSFLRANLGPPDSPAGAALRACHAPRPVAWWRRIGVGIVQAVGLAAASLLVQWAAPVSPGRWTFLAALILPVLVAQGWKGFWSGVWTALAVWAGSWLLWGSGFGWAPAGVALLISLGVSGLASGYLPPGGKVRLGWQESALDDATALWHNGGTGGYRSLVGFEPDSRVGVVVLSNSANEVDTIGMALLKALLESTRLQNDGQAPSGETPDQSQ